MSNDTVREIEKNIRRAKEVVEFGNALGRLRGNKDFKTVILSGYFEQEAIRLVHLKGDQNMQSQESQLSIVSQMNAISALSQYFNTTFHKAMLASKTVDSDQEALEELAAEELNNG